MTIPASFEYVELPVVPQAYPLPAPNNHCANRRARIVETGDAFLIDMPLEAGECEQVRVELRGGFLHVSLPQDEQSFFVGAGLLAEEVAAFLKQSALVLFVPKHGVPGAVTSYAAQPVALAGLRCVLLIISPPVCIRTDGYKKTAVSAVPYPKRMLESVLFPDPDSPLRQQKGSFHERSASLPEMQFRIYL